MSALAALRNNSSAKDPKRESLKSFRREESLYQLDRLSYPFLGYGDDNGGSKQSYDMWSDGNLMETIQQKRRTSQEGYGDNY